MSKTAKIWTAVIIVVVIIIGGLWYGMSAPQTSSTSPDASTAAATTAGSEQKVDPTAGTGLSSFTDSSNAALDQDATAIDAQMIGLSSDSASVDQSVNSSGN